MARAAPTVATVFRRYGEAFRAQAGAALSTAQRRVMSAIEQCRTAALGGHVDQCDHCGHRRVWYNSCRNRHCPQCQALARATWIQARTADLLDCEYFHVVFTLPQAIAEIALQNKAVVYGLLFRTVAETLRIIAADPTHLGAQLGFFAVLHTWGQTLGHHPHLHCVIPGGGLSPDGTRWVACRPGFFLPVRVLSRLFRRLFLDALHQAFRTGQLRFSGTLEALADSQGFADHLQATRRQEWVVYAKPPFAGPTQVLEYVGRYTHRVAIANHRLLDVEDGQVCFRYRDYRHNQSHKTMTLAAGEFIRRGPPPRAPARLPSHPLLRLPRQSPSRREAGPVSTAARDGRHATPSRRAALPRRLPRSVPRLDRGLAPDLSPVSRWPHARHRDLRGRPRAARLFVMPMSPALIRGSRSGCLARLRPRTPCGAGPALPPRCRPRSGTLDTPCIECEHPPDTNPSLSRTTL